MSVRGWDRLARAGAVLSALALFVAPERFLFGYLTAFASALTLVLGMLFFVLLHHAVDAGWSTVARRWAEHFLAALPALGVLFLGVVAGLPHLYGWAGAHAPGFKAVYLNVPFFLVRAALYFAVWILLARRFYGASLLQDDTGDASLSLGLRRLAGPGLILFAITLTFAAVDWLMTLDHHWFSTIFGTYVFGEGTLAALALLSLLAVRLRRGALAGRVTDRTLHDLGKLTFAFAVFWAYIAYSQWFLIWYGNIPEETGWMRVRWSGGWKPLTVAMVACLFVAPFVLLMRARAKRHPDVVSVTAAIVLAGHYLGIYWLVMPAAPASRHVWAEFAALLFVAGAVGGRVARAFARHPACPVHDPRLGEAVPEEIAP